MEAVAFTIAAIVAWSLAWPLWACVLLTVLAVFSAVAEVGSAS